MRPTAIAREHRSSAAAFVLLLSVACGNGGGLPTGPSPVMAEIEFRYEVTEAMREGSFGCNGVARLYPSWWGFTHATMILTEEGRWAALFESVPVGRQSVRVAPPSGCTDERLDANDVELRSSGDDLVFAFTVHPDGSVTP